MFFKSDNLYEVPRKQLFSQAYTCANLFINLATIQLQNQNATTLIKKGKGIPQMEVAFGKPDSLKRSNCTKRTQSIESLTYIQIQAIHLRYLSDKPWKR